MKQVVSAVAIALGLAVAACGDDGGAGGGGSGATGGGSGAVAEVLDCSGATIAQTISMNLPNFEPAAQTIKPGDVIKFDNDGTDPHTATSGTVEGGIPAPDEVWDTGTVPAGESACVRITAAGTYPYYCNFHFTTMQATITVQ